MNDYSLNRIKGIIPALPTPFTDTDEVAHEELKKLVEFLMASGVHGVFIVGNAGEFHALNEQEKAAILRTTRTTVGGKIPVFFGPGAATTAETVRLAKMAETEGADVISVITPYVTKLSDDELFQHFKAVSAATSLPVMVYNNPAVTGMAVTPRLMTRLSGLENIIGIKDSSGDLAAMLELIRIKKIRVFAGRDSLILSSLVHGGAGAVSAAAAVCPELAVAIYEAFTSGDPAAAARCQMELAGFRQMFGMGSFPSVIKAALRLRGFNVGVPRLPVVPLPAEKQAAVRECLARLHIL